MLFGIDVMRVESGKMHEMSTESFTGKSVREILLSVSGQDVVIKIHQGMLGDYFICGTETAAAPLVSKNRRILSCEAALNLWDGTPIPDLVWPITLPAL